MSSNVELQGDSNPNPEPYPNSEPNPNPNPSSNPEAASSSNKQTLKGTGWRWFALFLLNLALAGDYYCYDNPQALQVYLQQDLNINAEYYNSLYSVYCFPNIILPLVGGKFIDFVGVRFAFILFAGFCLVGQILFAIGGYIENFWVIFAGRAIYGFGGDCLSVAETFFLSQWFNGTELAFAYSFSDVVNGIFTGANDLLSARLYIWGNGLGLPLLVGAILCFISFLSAIGMLILDKYNDKLEGKDGPQSFFKENEDVNIRDMFHLPTLYWLMILEYGLLNGAFYDLSNVINGDLCTRYGFNPVSAGTLIAICIYGASTVLPPLWGKLIDSYGQRVYWTLSTGTCLLIAQALFILNRNCDGSTCYWPIPILPLIFMGLYISSCDSSTFPAFPIFLPERKLATAIAGCLVSANFTSTVGPVIVGLILDDAPNYAVGYVRVSWFVLGNAVAGIIVIGFLYFVDRKHGSRLQKVHEEFNVDDDWENEERKILKAIDDKEANEQETS